MVTQLTGSAARLAVATLCMSIACGAVSADAQPASSSSSTSTSPSPGTLISAANASSYAQILPPAADLGIKYGMTMRVVPTKRIDWSEGFTAATEKYSGQVGLDADDYITNYIAGMPFPTVSTTDPRAAVKIAYNWHMGPFMPDDFSLEPWGSFAYSSTEPGSFVAEDWNAYNCSRLVFLRYAHRTEVDPRPTLGTNEDGIEWELRCLEWRGGPDMSPGIGKASGAVIRYLDPKKADAAMWAGGRVTKYSPRRGFPDVADEKCRGCHQPYWAYALPKTEEYSYRLLGTTLMLACLTAEHEPAGIVQREKGLTFSEEPFQVRNAYILEMTPKGNQKLRTIVYIDTEAYVWLGAEFFAGNEKTEAAFPFWRSSPSSSGGYVFELAGEFYVPFDQLTTSHLPFAKSSATPRLFFRSLAPAHGGFSQKINSGSVSLDLFDPNQLGTPW